MEKLDTGTIPWQLSEAEESLGFDIQAGQSWVYPTNYPLRDYQFNIVQKALFQNTLVSLPTGLGKTFIAAVVMYNMFRWFPTGKIIFMAPTKPLVKQQVDACYNIMAIPKEVTTELTGTKTSATRPEIWLGKRVFFATPHVLQNDLNTILELGSKIKCLVFDEAHKAKGNYAYCEIVRQLKAQNHQYFRVLALSATPGNTVNDVLEVVNNLLISHLEFRTEESIDVRQYVFKRSLETVVVPLGETLQKVKDQYISILEYYTRTLLKYNVIHGNCSTLTKGKIFMTLKDFQQKQRGNSSSHYSEIMRSLNICITLYHAYELLERHGLRSFLLFFDEHIDKPLLRGNQQIREIMENIRTHLGPAPNVDILPDGTIPNVPESVKFGHPKYYKLKDVLVSHFQQMGNESRVIVFFEYRESVMEAYPLLLQARPTIRPKIFLGQGSGITQKVQVKAVKDFREGVCNVLLSTSIGEEGLDVGEVDLIVCFDISKKSPIRMVQRMGRTGRRRDGRVVILVTEGKEQQTLQECLIQKNNIAHYVLNSNELLKGMYNSSPRMVPKDIVPRCDKIFITVKPPVIKKNSTLKDIFRGMSSSSSEPIFSPDLEIHETVDRIVNVEMLCKKACPLDPQINYPRFSYSIQKQRSLQPTCIVRNSKSSETLVNLLQIADSRKFNIPMSQIRTGGANKSKTLKQSDIRNMFLISPSQSHFELNQPQQGGLTQLPNPTPSTQPDPPDFIKKYPKEIFTEISTYLSTNMTLGNSCKYCPPNVDCDKLCIKRMCDHSLHISKWIEPDKSIYESITKLDLQKFLNPDAFSDTNNKNDSMVDFGDQDIFAGIEFTQLENQANLNKNEDTSNEKSFSYLPPNNLANILDKCKNMDEMESQEIVENKITISKEYVLEVLSFFKLSSIEELFEESEGTYSQDTIICSPNIIDESPVVSSPESILNSPKTPESQKSPVLSQVNNFTDLGSPVLSACERLKEYKQKIANKLINNSTSLSQVSNNKTLICEQHLQDKDINGGKSTNQLENGIKSLNHNKKLDLDDICDLSMFGISLDTCNKRDTNFSKPNDIVPSNKSMATENVTRSNVDAVLEEIDDFCNLSDFGISSQDKCKQMPTIDNSASFVKPTSPVLNINQNNSFIMNKSISQMSETQILDYINKAKTQAINTQGNVSPKSTGEHNLNAKSAPMKNSTNLDNTIVDLTQDSPIKNNFERINNITTPKSENNISFLFSPPSSVRSKLSTKKDVNVDLTPLRKKEKKKLEDYDPYKIISQKTPTKSMLDTTILNNSETTSDDEFEVKPKSPLWIKPKAKRDIPRRNVDLDDKPSTSSRSLAKKNTCKTKKIINPFIDEEAQLSDDDFFISDDEENFTTEDLDSYDKSFVHDETQIVCTQMHAKYLESVRSPHARGKFKIPAAPKFNINNVYSQPIREDDPENTYLDDSFCVDENYEETQSHELSELEILEMKLKQRRKRKKEDIQPNTKRRRILVLSDSDDASD